MRDYPTIKRLLAGEIVDLGGIEIKKADGEILPGDLYVGERNTGPQLLTCREVSRIYGCIHAVEKAYAFDLHECVKIQEA